ncbi:murein biosynthesis integral membrane protein MurJ [Silvibacterium dinghuense]|uniref:Murein biosynthesis integral membrane protein MurJ n=1 Tax=Silvibacterium dinghuense TaxID=1560006 RepID=A0A4Q1SK13_9BACT|nr:murein biosynthesis integral membrane protein MurJ [Silvibacterium dinghuense]RXS98006.1 murein biosynthesis integral membrane protein MurJ [Silvibacterium dinghuense]GGH03759.1 lipid II flippase MurJ [Silvibacterium dinghuense]
MSTTPTTPRWQRAFAMLRPSHSHTAFTATLLLMASAMASRVIGLVRTKYIAYLLGRTSAADAFNAAFQLPDQISYFLVGGAASITFVTMLTRYREAGREAEGERSMSIILTTMAMVLSVAILAAEFLAPLYVHTVLSFTPGSETAVLCARLTRILLPAQLFFLAGGIFASVLLVRKQFAVQAVTPLVYNCGIILGGVLLYRTLDSAGLAVGAVAGAFLGPFLLNAIWAHRVGIRYRPILDWKDKGLHEWVRMSIPLMLGVSLVSADNWIINKFASYVSGDLSLLTYAKQLFTAPVALGQAAGAASLPFLASLYGKRDEAGRPDRAGFAQAVNTSVSQILAFSILLSAFMIAMALPLVDVLLRGGAFHRADSATMASYFAVFSVSLCLWSAQAIYARAFYAAANTLTPMIAGTIVTAVSIPVYALLFHSVGAIGLAVASDIGILIQTLTLAVLLHRRGMVPAGGLNYAELLRSLVAAAAGYAALVALRHYVYSNSRLIELGVLALATVLWVLVSGAVLKLIGSKLPDQLIARFLKRGK